MELIRRRNRFKDECGQQSRTCTPCPTTCTLGKFGNFGLEPVRVYVMPCYSPWMSVDGATGAAYVALLAADNEDDFWQAATSLQITRDDRDYPQQRRLSLSSLRHLVQDLALVLTMRRQWKHFRFVCTCVLAYNSCLHLSGPIVLFTQKHHIEFCKPFHSKVSGFRYCVRTWLARSKFCYIWCLQSRSLDPMARS